MTDLRPTLQHDTDEPLMVSELDGFYRAYSDRLADYGITVEDDGWFTSGADAAHQQYLDELEHVNADVMVDGS